MSEQVNGRVSSPVLTSLFLFVPDHSGVKALKGVGVASKGIGGGPGGYLSGANSTVNNLNHPFTKYEEEIVVSISHLVKGVVHQCHSYSFLLPCQIKNIAVLDLLRR